MVTKRLVFHIGGYEPLTPEAVYRRFLRELRRFEGTWSAAASVSEPTYGPEGAAWRVVTTGPNWRVETEYRLVRWDDLIEEGGRRPMWRRIPLGLAAFVSFIAGGAFWGYLRTNWRYAAFFLYPYVLFTAFAAIAVLVGMFVARWLDSAFAGLVAGAVTFALLLRWPGRRFYLPLLFDDWTFSNTYLRRGHPLLDRRLDRAAQEVVAATRGGNADEILILGHSLGAVLAVDLVDRALTIEPELGQSGPSVALLTVGSSLLKIGLHGGAKSFRAALARVAAARAVFWGEYQAIIDIMNFYKCDPIATIGLAPTGRPVVRIVRISRMLDRAYYRRIKRDFFRLHRQFVSGNDRRATYDYFMLLCGPFSAEHQVRAPEGAAAGIGPDGELRREPSGGESAIQPSGQTGHL